MQRALEIANQQELDLVEVAPAATPPVCRIIEYSKFKYDLEKKEREAKQGTVSVRKKGLGDQGVIALEEFVGNLINQIQEHK